MKLKCHHKRRVVIVGEWHRVLHRSDGSLCNDDCPKIGDSTVDTRELDGLVMYDKFGNRRVMK